MATVEGVSKLTAQLEQRRRAVNGRFAPGAVVKVEVGYGSPYALAVHENRQMVLKGVPRPSGIGKYWDARGGQGRAGFLLDVEREMTAELRETVLSYIRRGRTMDSALMAAGRQLQRQSMTQVPYEFGPLRESAFTRLQEE